MTMHVGLTGGIGSGKSTVARLFAARGVPGATVLAAGVAADADGALVTAGGRVLNVVGRGTDAAEARRCAYEALAHVRWPGLHHRSDIALTP